MIALTRRLLPAILIALAVVALIPIARANGRNLQVLHAVDMSRPDPLGVLTLKSTALLESSLWQRTAGPCLDIWQSRLLASYELEQATRLVAASADCPRDQQGQLIWRGNLAWLRGEEAQAAAYWEQLPPEEQLEYARTLLLNGRETAGRAALSGLSGDQDEHNVEPDFLEQLGDVHRLAGHSEAALAAYQEAWQAGRRGFSLAYYLGRGLARRGDCAQAVTVFESGESYKRSRFRPTLEISYYQLWSQCLMTTGETEAALRAYRQSRQALQKAETVAGVEAFSRYRQRLDRLEKSLPAP